MNRHNPLAARSLSMRGLIKEQSSSSLPLQVIHMLGEGKGTLQTMFVALSQLYIRRTESASPYGSNSVHSYAYGNVNYLYSRT